jgi:hypothetical protein
LVNLVRQECPTRARPRQPNGALGTSPIRPTTDGGLTIDRSQSSPSSPRRLPRSNRRGVRVAPTPAHLPACLRAIDTLRGARVSRGRPVPGMRDRAATDASLVCYRSRTGCEMTPDPCLCGCVAGAQPLSGAVRSGSPTQAARHQISAVGTDLKPTLDYPYGLRGKDRTAPSTNSGRRTQSNWRSRKPL